MAYDTLQRIENAMADTEKMIEMYRDKYKEENIPDKEILEVLQIARAEHKEILKYREMEQALKNVYGDCEGLLEAVVYSLAQHEKVDLPNTVIKSRLLTDESVDRWEAYKAIGTVEECRTAMEKRLRKKPTVKTDKLCGDLILHYFCPSCGKYFGQRGKHNIIIFDKERYCQGEKCGQAIDWSE